MVIFDSLRLGDYAIKAKIGSGGMADLYLAEKGGSPGEIVAIKKLRKEFVYDREFIDLLFSEFETLNRLKHPNIVTAHQWFSKGEDHFIVLEFVDGCTLRALLDKIKTINSKIPVPIALEIGIQIADALQYIHTFTDKEKKGICLVHSDLNPNNILLDRSGLIKLIDFSTAQTTENIIGDTANKGRGIILYMSPEQAKSEGVDVRSDIFSLGILLFEMLLGTPPFPGESQLEVYYNLMGKEIAPKTFPIAMENDLKMILCKLLQKRKEDRYQTMEEVRLVLRDFKKNSFPSFTLKEIADFLKPLNEGF